MPHRLFVYGTLAPGRPNAHVLADVPGKWEPATTTGTLVPEGWGAAAGYPGIILDEHGGIVPGFLFSSEALADALDPPRCVRGRRLRPRADPGHAPGRDDGGRLRLRAERTLTPMRMRVPLPIPVPRRPVRAARAVSRPTRRGDVGTLTCAARCSGISASATAMVLRRSPRVMPVAGRRRALRNGLGLWSPLRWPHGVRTSPHYNPHTLGSLAGATSTPTSRVSSMVLERLARRRLTTPARTGARILRLDVGRTTGSAGPGSTPSIICGSSACSGRDRGRLTR